jgi:WD40 repeat protein
VRGEIWGIGSKNNRIIYSNKPGQLIVSRLEKKGEAPLPVLITESKIDLETTSIVRSVVIDGTTERLACGTIDGNVILVRLDSFPPVQQAIYNHNNNRVLYLAFVPGKDWLISSSTDRTIQIWDLNQMKTVKILTVKDPVQKFVITGSEHLIFTTPSGNILNWDLNRIDSEPKVLYSNVNNRPYNTVAFDATHNRLAVSSLGELFILPLKAEKQEILKPEQFAVRHKAVISQLSFSPDNQWLISASQDAVMFWDMRDVEIKDVDKIIPVIVENNRHIFSIIFDENSKYLMHGDNKFLHIYPFDIQDVYKKLKFIMGSRELKDQEWKFYVKGDLEKPHGK